MNIANNLIDLGDRTSNAILHCNEMLATKGVSGASSVWEVGDKIGEIIINATGDFIDIIEGDITNVSIPYGLTIIRDYVFSSCKSLIDINLPNSVTSIGDYAFYKCTSLTSVTIPDSVTSIGADAFSGCNALTNIYFSENSQLTEIDGSAFAWTGLNKFVVPSGVETLVGGTFIGSKLTSFILPKTSSIVNTTHYNLFDYTPIASGTGYIYVPQALIEEYKAATNWSTYASQFRAIEDYPDIVGG